MRFTSHGMRCSYPASFTLSYKNNRATAAGSLLISQFVNEDYAHILISKTKIISEYPPIYDCCYCHLTIKGRWVTKRHLLYTLAISELLGTVEENEDVFAAYVKPSYTAVGSPAIGMFG